MLNFKNIYYDGPLDGGGRIWIDYIKHYDEKSNNLFFTALSNNS